MMSIQNLGSEESLGVKMLRWHMCQSVFLVLEVTGIFVILLSQNGFKSDSPEIKF